MTAVPQVTLRLPKSVVEALRSEAETGRSINDLVGTVLAEYTGCRVAFRAVRDVAAIRARVKAERGQRPDSTEIMRSPRQGDRLAMTCCLDASVFIRWLVPEDGSEAA